MIDSISIAKSLATYHACERADDRADDFAEDEDMEQANGDGQR